MNYSTENQEKEDKPKEEETKEPVAEEKPKMRSSHQKEEATSFTSGVFALLDVYLTKMLVSQHVDLYNILHTRLILASQAGPVFDAVLYKNTLGLKSTSSLKLLNALAQQGAVVR